MDLDSMKYAELRSLAKEIGLKANMKAEKLMKALKQHYEQEKKKEEEGQGQDDHVQEEQSAAQDGQEAACKEEASSTSVFVNTRRGKNCPKRKISDTATVTECDAPNAAEVDAEMDASSAPCDSRAAKKRKVSSAKDADQTEAQPQTTGSKDEEAVHGKTEKTTKAAKPGKIPRYQKTQQKKKPLLKPVTPNFKKLHEAHFNKMESIDSYVQRKTKVMETYKKSDVKKPLDKTKPQQVDRKSQLKTNPTRATMFSPISENKNPAGERRRHTLLSASKTLPNKPSGKEDVPFRPSVLSTRRINVRFSEATCDNEHKKSLVKTPARMSPFTASITPQKQTATGGKTSSVKIAPFSATKTPGTFVFTGNTSISTTPGTQKKPNFDLKASLSRPLGYKPHKGKLKPFGEAKEDTTKNKSVVSNTHQESYKQHKVQSRDDRRAKQTEGRKQKKENMLGARRGLVMM
ncbi:nucleolar and spindle-associated protein 1 [Mugil cephalus]|uniref:nucleolar and spindle-associated protein 1 n=1 Tax=Mugil cephalus TaxID=48193 RepID=UPI001FB5D0E4|nr:nucleolar and spindle-associated protein 1 [Mugil cephalus]